MQGMITIVIQLNFSSFFALVPMEMMMMSMISAILQYAMLLKNANLHSTLMMNANIALSD